MAWVYLLCAGVFEVIAVMGINLISRKKNIMSFLVFLLGFGFSFLLLSLAMRTISMGTAYAIWTGIGTVGSGLIGILVYGESRSWKRILFMAMVLSASIGLKMIA